jgi:heme exporter protein B
MIAATLAGAWRIARKDLAEEWRSKEAVNASLAFAVSILLMFSFAFDPTSETTREISGGLLWLVFTFAGALILNRGFSRELENDCLPALVASPLSGASLFLGKAIASYALLTAVEALCLPIYGVFYNVRWLEQIGPLAGVWSLTTWGLTVIGTIFSALTVHLRLRELMLPVLVYPLLIPALLPAIQISSQLLAGQPFTSDLTDGLRLIVGFDIIFTALALGLVDTILGG